MTENSLTQSLKWVRAEDGIIGGVCLGLARQMNVDPWMVRLAWLTALLIFGTGVLAYLLCVLAFPRTDRLSSAYDKKILGVCARIAKRSNTEVGLVRLLALLLLIVTGGLAVVGYFVFHLTLSIEGEKTRSLL